MVANLVNDLQNAVDSSTSVDVSIPHETAEEGDAEGAAVPARKPLADARVPPVEGS